MTGAGAPSPDSDRGSATALDRNLARLLLAAEHAVDIGARILAQGSAHIGALIGKGDRDFATDVDLQIEAEIRASLAAAVPELPFLGEEEGGVQELGHARWVLDPIDGTINFARDSPLCSISLSLVIAGQPVLGIVDAPLLGERFIARQGGGAYLNGVPIAISEIGGLREGIVGIADFKVGAGSEEENRVHLAVLARLARECLRVRMLGSAALDLAWLAAGAAERDGDAVEPAVGCDCRPAARARGRRGGVRLRWLPALRRLEVHAGVGSVAVRAGTSDRRGGDVRRRSARRRRVLAALRSMGRRRWADGRVAVFAPSPLLTVTIEPGTDRPEVHMHAGGQGFWVARLAGTLRAEVTLCCALGGEPGRVLKGLIEVEPVRLRAAAGSTPNGVYIHDRRSGTRVEVVSVDSRPLERHAADELYGIALGAGLDADVTMVTGCQPADVVDADLYRRLVTDLRANGKLVIADLTGPPLRATLQAGVELLRLSEEELVRDRYAASDSPADIAAGAQRLHVAGARRVLISRGSAPALLIDDGPDTRPVELVPPVFEALDERGAGDSMFAATGVGLARGMRMIEALRLGMAAGALNATRRGLGTGTRDEIERLAAHVIVRP
jgi:1-phosphofructokinase